MPKAYGNNAHVGVAIETTYGTPVTTATDFLEIQSEGWGLTEELAYSSTLNTRSMRLPVEGKRSTAGSIEIEAVYQGMEEYIGAIMGAASVTTGTVNADGQYTHTFALKESSPVGYTLQVNRDASGSGSGFIYPGVQFNKATFAQAMGEYMKATFEGTGNGVETSGSTMTATSFASFKGIKWGDLLTCTINGVADIAARNIELSIENPLADDVYKLGTKTRQELKFNGARSITGKMELYFDGLTQYALGTAGTEFAMTLAWRGPLIAGSSYYEISFTMPKCRATIDAPKVSGSGPIPLNFAWQAVQSAAANDELVVVVKNTKATM